MVSMTRVTSGQKTTVWQLKQIELIERRGAVYGYPNQVAQDSPGATIQ